MDACFRCITSMDDVEYNETIPLEERNLPNHIYEIFKNSAARYGNKIALRFLLQGTEEKDQAINYTYNSLLAYISQTSIALQNLNIGKDDVVAILLPNLPQNHFTLWAAETVGIASPINPLLEPAHIISIMHQTKAKVLVTLSSFPNTNLWEKAQEIAKQVPCLTTILTVDMRQFLPQSHRPEAQTLPEKINDISIYDFDRYISQFSEHASFHCQKNWDDTASYFHTGGTTGAPKIAKQSHGNQIFSAWMVGKQLDWTDKDIMHCGLPLFHVNAPLISGLAPFTVGGEVIMTSPQGFRNPAVLDHFADLIKEYNMSFFMGVPTIFSELNNRWKDRNDIGSLTSLRFAACGAAPLSPAVMSRFKEITQRLPHLTIVEGYGLTEGTVFSTVTAPFTKKEIKKSIGIRIPYQQIEIATLDENGKAELDEYGQVICLGPNETGTIIIRGPNVFQGYLNEKDNEKVWADKSGGWLNTGDLARKNEEGYFFLIGRKKDLIIRGGHNIDPKLIEEPFSQHPDVAIVAAIGKPDKRVGELPMAYIQLHPGAKITMNDLHDYAKKNIYEQAARPHQIEIIQIMPLTSVGKIFKPALRILTTKKIFDEELSFLKAIDVKFEITASLDNTNELIVIITIENSVNEEVIKKIRSHLEDFSIRFELKQNANSNNVH